MGADEVEGDSIMVGMTTFGEGAKEKSYKYIGSVKFSLEDAVFNSNKHRAVS